MVYDCADCGMDFDSQDKLKNHRDRFCVNRKNMDGYSR